MFLRRILGAIMLLVAIAGIAISIALVVLGRQAIDSMAESIGEVLQLASDSLTNSQQMLVVTKGTLEQVDRTMTTIDGTVLTVADTLDETQPVLEELTTVATEDVPANIEAVQMALPDMVAAADAIDETLRLLDSFAIDESILGFPIQFDLGIQYDPETPFDETVSELGDSLEGMPERLRALETDTTLAAENLSLISSDLRQLSTELVTMSDSIEDIEPFLDEYIRISSEANDRILQTRGSLNRDVAQFKLLLTLGMVWIGLAQIAPLYLGAMLLAGRRATIEGDAVIAVEGDTIIEDVSGES